MRFIIKTIISYHYLPQKKLPIPRPCFPLLHKTVTQFKIVFLSFETHIILQNKEDSPQLRIIPNTQKINNKYQHVSIKKLVCT